MVKSWSFWVILSLKTLKKASLVYYPNYSDGASHSRPWDRFS